MPHFSSQHLHRERSAFAHWKTVQDSAKLPPGREILKGDGRLAHPYNITSTGKLIGHALALRSDDTLVVRRIKRATGVSPLLDPANRAKRHRLSRKAARTGRAAARINVSSLIDLIASIPFQHADLHAKDILGHVYDWSGATESLPKESPKGERGGAHQYFLGQFALAEGKKCGQYFTPKAIVSLVVEMIEPYQGRVNDPAMGSGGFFVRNTRPSGVRFAKRCRASARGVVQSERFIQEHGGKLGILSVYGQDQWAWGAHLRRAKRARRVRLRRKQPNQCNPTIWRLAAMNMAIRGIDFNFGKEPANSVIQDQDPDLLRKLQTLN